jgi:hypothetical protein
VFRQLIKFFLAFCPIRYEGAQQPIKAWAVVVFIEVTEFVEDYIVHAIPRGFD